MRIDIPNFQGVQVLVVGDLMLDRYWHGQASRISPEAPVPVVRVTDTEERPGGAGNVALNLATLGCTVSLLSAVGDDAAALVLRKQLEAAGIHCMLQSVPGFSTIVKSRVIGRNQQIVRLDFEHALGMNDAVSLFESSQSHLSKMQILVLSDYAKGVLAHPQAWIGAAKRLGIPVLVDPKSADFSQYRGATLVTPNQKEFEAVVGSCADQAELIAKGHALMRDFEIHALLVTQSEQGMTLLQEGASPIQLPTRAREVFDVTGAGDTVIAVLAAVLGAGAPLELAANLANTAAGVVIRKLGAGTVSLSELRRALQRQQQGEFGILSEAELLVAVEDARMMGEKIVMTNGCFDILHAGHVQYLAEARTLGQRLIVAVNDDASVAALKGSTRPVNPLHERMIVLESLRAVDWVVPFSELTPERLIRRVRPDILVKAGDYRVEQIAGADFVLETGGAVKIMPFRPDCSTSRVVAKIQGFTG